MAARSGDLSRGLLDWIGTRLYLTTTSGADAPRWPPASACLECLERGEVLDALAVGDDPNARYVVLGELRADAPHLLLARDQVMGREVVIKLLRILASNDRATTVREARLTARIHHPHIVVIHDVDPEGLYLVLERMDGDAKDLVEVAPDLILDAFCQAGRGLAAAHAFGVTHGDLRAENILVRLDQDAEGKVRSVWANVGDFGQAWELKTRPQPTGQLPASYLEDQHAFASALWECLTWARRPGGGDELMPGWLHAVLARALMTEPSQRWADMTALVDAIERGREATAAASIGAKQTAAPPSPSPSGVLGWAIPAAEDGQFGAATQRWRELRELLTRDPVELGCAGLSLAAALGAAARRAPDATKQLGFARCLDVLQDTIRALEAAGDESAPDARQLAAETCLEWMKTYLPNSPNHRQLAALAAELMNAPNQE